MRNSFHICQEPFLEVCGYTSAMPNETDMPLEVIRENMERLMRARGWVHDSGKDAGKVNHRKLALKAGVDAGTIGNLLDPEWKSAPTLRILTKIAKALGVGPWQLLMPRLPTDKDANDMLKGGIDEDAYKLAAVYQVMQPEARERVRAVLGFVATHPDTISTSDLLRAAKRAG